MKTPNASPQAIELILNDLSILYTNKLLSDIFISRLGAASLALIFVTSNFSSALICPAVSACQ